MTISQSIDFLVERFGWTALDVLTESERAALIEDAMAMSEQAISGYTVEPSDLHAYANTLIACKRHCVTREPEFTSPELDALCGELPSWAV